MPWMEQQVAMSTIQKKQRYKVKLRPKGMKQFLTVDRKEMLRFMNDYPDMHFLMPNLAEAKVDRTFYIFDYGDKPE